jgi:photosystem II stability/assembly factor-like uncharacterized protein
VWGVGDGGTLVTMADGLPWTQVESPVPARLDAVCFAADGRGSAVGAGGTAIRTAGGGAAWTRAAAPTQADLFDVDLAPDGSGWAVGATATVLRTEDAGATWRAQLPVVDADTDLEAVRALGSGRAVVVGGDAWGQGHAVVLSTADGGQSWSAVQVPDMWGELQDVAFSAALDGCAVGSDYGPDGDFLSGVILRTVDGGASWTKVAAVPTALQTVVFLDPLHGWAGGGGGALWRTEDGGFTWREALPVTATDVYGLTAADAAHLWLAGGGGAILFTDGGAQEDPVVPPPVVLPKAGNPTLDDLRHPARLRD